MDIIHWIIYRWLEIPKLGTKKDLLELEIVFYFKSIETFDSKLLTEPLQLFRV